MQFVIERPFTVAVCGTIMMFALLPALEGSVASIGIVVAAAGFVLFRYLQYSRKQPSR